MFQNVSIAIISFMIFILVRELVNVIPDNYYIIILSNNEIIIFY